MEKNAETPKKNDRFHLINSNAPCWEAVETIKSQVTLLYEINLPLVKKFTVQIWGLGN